jgi:hypothetical protein
MIAHLNEDALKALPDDGPVTMLNLMRFRERSLDGNGSGWDAYLRYSALTIKLIKARSGTIIWTGSAEDVALGVPDLHRWDYVALVLYPARRVPRHDDVGRIRGGQRRARERLRRPRHHRRQRDLSKVHIGLPW